MDRFSFSKKNVYPLVLVFLGFGLSSKSQERPITNVPFGTDTIQIQRLNSTSLLLQLQELQVLINPSGKLSQTFTGELLDLIIITDDSETSFDLSTLQGLHTQNAKIVVPWQLAQRIPLVFTPQLDPLKHLDTKERFGVIIMAYYKENKMIGYLLKEKNRTLFIGANGAKTFLPEEIQKIDLAIVSGNGINKTVSQSPDAARVANVFPYNYEEHRALFLSVWKKAQPNAKILSE